MADTETLFIPVEHYLPMEDYDRCGFPLKGLRGFDQDGVVDKPFYRWMTARSPLTGAEYRVKAVPLTGSPNGHIAGYIVEINIPACTVGHNLLLVNGVPMASKLACLLFKHWLITSGCSKYGLRLVQFDKVRLHSVTPTYLFRCDDLADAHAARREFSVHSEGVLNPKVYKKGSPNPAFSVGPVDNATSYIKHRQYLVSAYVKDGTATKAYAVFDSPAIEQAIRAEAAKYLRVEVAFGGVWLQKMKLDTPDAWLLADGRENPYKVGVDLIRKVLLLDADLRTRAPKEEHIAQLSEADRNILRWHLAAGRMSTRQHPLILAKPTVHDQNVYFARVKDRLIESMKVDISILWAVQSKEMSPRLADLLKFGGQLKPLASIADHIFSPASVPELIERLEDMIEAIMPDH